MANQSKPKKVSSPIATGGAGGDFERRVGAYYLAAMLAEATGRGSPSGVVHEVAFQRLYAGDPMDDVVVTSLVPAGAMKLALQLKRDLAFGEKDEVFAEVMEACWQTFTSDRFAKGSDRFGIVLGLYSKNVDEHYQSVLAWARTSSSAADFLTRISVEGLSSATQRTFVALVRKKLSSAKGSDLTDDELWNFLRSMVILHFDFGAEGSRDYLLALEMLRRALPPGEHGRAQDLFLKLVDCSAEANRTAGSFSGAVIRERLQSEGFALAPPADCAPDLGVLQEHASLVLADIGSEVAGVGLPRQELHARARSLVGSGRLIEIAGPAGSGKSALLKALAEEANADGTPLILSGDRITGPGWNAFASSLGLARRLPDLLAAAGSGSSPALFIDGADRVTDPGARKTVNDLLRIVGQYKGSARPWSVVVTFREENRGEVRGWIDLAALGKPESVEVGLLTDEEAKAVAAAAPRLQSLMSIQRLRPVTRNPFLLEVAIDPRLGEEPGEGAPASESEVAGAWWERVIGGGAAGRMRQQALLGLGRRAATATFALVSGEGIGGEELFSLEADGILMREPGRDVYRFRHDIFEDWVLARVLDARRDDLAKYLAELGQPNRLARPLGHLARGLLEAENGSAAWLKVLEDLERAQELSPRWQETVLTAPLGSPRGASLLAAVEAPLWAEEGRRLERLLVAIRTTEVSPDFSLYAAAERVAESPEEILPLLLGSPVPRWETWVRFLAWLVSKLDDVPSQVRYELAKVLDIWQQKAPSGLPFRKEIGEAALRWLKEAERWRTYEHA